MPGCRRVEGGEMTLESTVNKNRYVGNGSTRIFPFTFKVWKKNQVAVWIGDGVVENEVSSQCDVSITASGGSVAFPYAPDSGKIIVICRAMPFVQEDDYKNGSRFNAEEIEDRLDQDCAERQDLRLALNRAIKFPRTASFDADEFTRILLQGLQQMEEAGEIAGASLIKSTGSTTYRTISDRFSDIANVKDYGAKGIDDENIDDTSAIQRALDTGKPTFVPAGTYFISDTLYTTKAGQIFFGSGIGSTTIKNSTNNKPLFCFGDITSEEGATEGASVRDMSLHGNETGETLWGVYCPCHASGNQGPLEGVSPSDSNYYYGAWPSQPAAWSSAARNCSLENVEIRYIYGGFALNVTAWCFNAKNVSLWSSQNGLRLSGYAYNNTFQEMYISGIENSGISFANRNYCIPVACSVKNSVVQNCGFDNYAAIEVYKGYCNSFTNIYSERNKKANFYFGVASVGTLVDGNNYNTNSNTDAYWGPTTFEANIITSGQGLSVNNIVLSGESYSENAVPVKIIGNDTRTSTKIGYVVSPTDNLFSAENPTKVFFSDISTLENGVVLGSGGKSTPASDGLKIEQNSSSSKQLKLSSLGGVDFNIRSGGVDSDRYFTFSDGSTEQPLTFIRSDGSLFPGGTTGTKPLGTGSNRWSEVFAANGTINTSDNRAKSNIADPSEKLMQAWGKVRFKVFQMNDAIERKGNSARLHIGVIAQSVQDAFSSDGLDASRYGLFCYDKWEDEYEEIEVLDCNEKVDENGNVIEPKKTHIEKRKIASAGDSFGIRYEEALALECAYQRWRLEQLEERVNKLTNNGNS